MLTTGRFNTVLPNVKNIPHSEVWNFPLIPTGKQIGLMEEAGIFENFLTHIVKLKRELWFDTYVEAAGFYMHTKGRPIKVNPFCNYITTEADLIVLLAHELSHSLSFNKRVNLMLTTKGGEDQYSIMFEDEKEAVKEDMRVGNLLRNQLGDKMRDRLEIFEKNGIDNTLLDNPSTITNIKMVTQHFLENIMKYPEGA